MFREGRVLYIGSLQHGESEYVRVKLVHPPSTYYTPPAHLLEEDHHAEVEDLPR